MVWYCGTNAVYVNDTVLQGKGSKAIQFRVYNSISVLLTVRFSSVGLAVDALEQERWHLLPRITPNTVSS